MPIATAPGWEWLVPRPTIGIMANTAGKTSYGYVASTWTIDITRWLFLEPVVGTAIHDGELDFRGTRHGTAWAAACCGMSAATSAFA